MAYFDQVTPPPNILDSQNKLNNYILLLQNIEKRAMEVVNDKYPYIVDIVGKNPIIIDPYANYSPDDTNVWLDIFMQVHENRELYARLFFIRGGGTKLVKNQKWGYIFQPIIGFNAWESMAQYDQEKQCLNEYKNDVVKILQGIKEL